MRSLRLQSFNLGLTECDALMLSPSIIILINWRNKFEDKKKSLSLQTANELLCKSMNCLWYWKYVGAIELGLQENIITLYNDKVYI